MIFHVPPRNGGRIVEVAYAAPCDGMVVRRTHDRSDRTTIYHITRMLRDDVGDYWQREPRNRRWRPMKRKELEAYAVV